MISRFRAACTFAATVSAIVLSLAPASTFAAFTAPERITVVTDLDYPVYLFTSADGELPIEPDCTEYSQPYESGEVRPFCMDSMTARDSYHCAMNPYRTSTTRLSCP